MPEPTQIAVAPEKRYETDVRSDSDYNELPSKVRFVLSEADAHEIVRLSALVAANGLHKVEKFDSRPSWLEGDDPDAFIEVRCEADSLNVSAKDFWFSGYLKHTDVEVLSGRQRVSELKEWLGIQEGFILPEQTPDAATVALQVLEAIRTTNPELIADNMPPGWGMNKLRKAMAERTDVAKTKTSETPRVLVVVSGGVADHVCDAGVDVEVFDWDNYKDDPEGTGGVPDHFADLAEPIYVPVGEAAGAKDGARDNSPRG